MSQIEQCLKVAFLGPEATYSHQAALQLFSSGHETEPTQLLARPTIDSLFEAVGRGDVDYSVVPLVNSTNGSVAQTLTAIVALSPTRSIEACGSTLVSVRHCLAGRRRGSKASIRHQDWSSPEASRAFSHIKSLHTHSQAWSQCTPFLTEHFGKSVDRRSETSTAEAAAKVAADKAGESAAICSRLAAQLFGLDILADEIQSDHSNTTKFLVLRRRKDSLSMPLAADFVSSSVRELFYVCEVDPAMLKTFDTSVATDKTAGIIACTNLSLGLWRLVFVDISTSTGTIVEHFDPRFRGFAKHLWEWGQWQLSPGDR